MHHAASGGASPVRVASVLNRSTEGIISSHFSLAATSAALSVSLSDVTRMRHVSCSVPDCAGRFAFHAGDKPALLPSLTFLECYTVF